VPPASYPKREVEAAAPLSLFYVVGAVPVPWRPSALGRAGAEIDFVGVWLVDHRLTVGAD
jgi:hypothetical protein